ncbi:MAG: hypothetical protein IT516_16725 [Burkholderiales bacterium]|nr:hypothetical protein [Burkholderiales bacterium]
MDMLAPEFARHWLADHAEDAAAPVESKAAVDEASEEAALEDLAERVQAARLVR